MNDIKKVLVLFKTHLDIGFTDFAANVVDLYMKSYIPSAVRTAKLLRESGKVDEARLIWTTGSWLIWEYLRTHDGEEAEAVRQAIELGDISWHGLPFTSHIELMTSDLFEYGISLSQELDREFGKKTIGSKLTDVNGHTRAIIPYMKKAGIEFLHVGINNNQPADSKPAVQNDYSVTFSAGSIVIQLANATEAELEKAAEKLMKIIERKQQLKAMAVRS